MCGICGKLSFDTQSRINEELIGRMCDAIQHRGPDEHGIYIDRYVGLGHRRLSIIDLATGQQPMTNDRRDLWIVFNGEIYNFPELRKTLDQHGYTFHSNSDTEVILHLYDRYGVECVNHLRGMFAFAIWDKKQQRLFLARDRVGQKPLVYRLTEEGITFASEIKSLLEEPSCRHELNINALSHYLTYQYIPPPDTIFQGIHKLPPAHILICEKGTTIIKQYWDLQYVPKMERDEHEVLEEARELLQECVKMRMISDVPLGAFLSGGIDSSLVVALMSQYTSQPVKTFSIGFKEKLYNELPYARLLAEQYQTDHQEFIVEPDALETLPKLIWHFEEPFGDPAAIPTYYLSQMTSQYVKVALNGDGGDETFAGYQRYLGHRRAEYFALLPDSLRRTVLSPIFQKLSDKLDRGYGAGKIRYLRMLNDLSLQSKESRYFRIMTIFHDSQKQTLLSEDVRAQLPQFPSKVYADEYFRASNAQCFTDKMLYTDVMTYLPGALLVKIDRMTMAFGLEGRSPFLDHKLMEFMATLPIEYKVKGGNLKYLLKKLAKDWLPESIIRRKKQGFQVPLTHWFRHELHDMLHDTFSSSCLAQDGICNRTTMQRMLEEHRNGIERHPHRIWLLLNLELWYRMFIKNA